MTEGTNCQEVLDGSTCKQSLQVAAVPAIGIDSEYVNEVATLMAQLGIAKDDIAEHLQAVARFRNLVLNLDINDAQWEAMIRWFREFMRTFGGFDNGTEG